MKKLIAYIAFIATAYSSAGQELDVEKSITIAKNFMHMVYDMTPFDSVAKVTTLDRSVPKALVKFSSGYFNFAMLRLQAQQYPLSGLSYVPYLDLPQNNRCLVYERFIDGIPNGIELSNVYGVLYKGKVVTFLDVRSEKIWGIGAAVGHDRSCYLHEFSMDNIDNDPSVRERPLLKESTPKNLSAIQRMTFANSFLRYIYDSLSFLNFGGFTSKLEPIDTTDFYTAYFPAEILKQRLAKYPYQKLKITPFEKLPKKQKENLIVSKEKLGQIFAVKYKKEILTYLCLEGDKIKYFLTLKNLRGKHVFMPYKYVPQTASRE